MGYIFDTDDFKIAYNSCNCIGISFIINLHANNIVIFDDECLCMKQQIICESNWMEGEEPRSKPIIIVR